MVKVSNLSNILAMHYILLSISLCIFYLTLVDGLYQDQVGKFDWHKQFIGIPEFVYHHPGSNNLIIGSKSNVIASLHTTDGSIIWRRLMPNGCSLDSVSILKSSDDHQDYLIRTSCTPGNQSLSSNSQLSQYWSPQNGLLATDSRYKEVADYDQAESVLADQGHLIENGNFVEFSLSDVINLLVASDGRVSYDAAGRRIWTREESLASVVAAEIVRLPLDMRDKFGLKKMIVLVTECGKIFGVDTFTGEVEWELFEQDLSSKDRDSMLLILTKQSDKNVDSSRAVIIHPNGMILQINPITGTIIEKKKLSNRFRQVALTEMDETSKQRGVILLDTQNIIHVYPEDLKTQVQENIDKYYLTVKNEKPIQNLEGFKLVIEGSSIVPKLVWMFPINELEQIVKVKIKRMDEEVHSPAKVLGDRGILYKYINPNLIAIMTQGNLGDSCTPDYYTNIYLVDGVTGSLVHTVKHSKSHGPTNVVHAENWLVYSYYNTKTRRTEVSSLEMFEGTTQTNSSAFSSITRAAIKPKLIEHKSFIFPSGIDAMTDTITLRGMTNKHIIVALPTGSLLEIPKIFLDPRRPINMLMEHREEGLIPYMPELPVPSESMINYDRILLGVRKIITSPAMLESTSLVFAYGLDLYFTRVTPSKTFDILKDDFDHLLITAVLIFLVVASYVSKLLAQRKALKAAWK